MRLQLRGASRTAGYTDAKTGSGLAGHRQVADGVAHHDKFGNVKLLRVRNLGQHGDIGLYRTVIVAAPDVSKEGFKPQFMQHDLGSKAVIGRCDDCRNFSIDETFK